MRGAEPTEPRDDRAVVGVDVGDEPVGPSGPCCGHRLLEEARADALSLSGVGDLDRDLHRSRVDGVPDPAGQTHRPSVDPGDHDLVAAGGHGRQPRGPRRRAW